MQQRRKRSPWEVHATHRQLTQAVQAAHAVHGEDELGPREKADPEVQAQYRVVGHFSHKAVLFFFSGDPTPFRSFPPFFSRPVRHRHPPSRTHRSARARSPPRRHASADRSGTSKK